MAHFIILFFLSIGAHFGQPNFDQVSISKSKVQSLNYKYSNSANPIKSPLKRNLYSDNRNIIKIQPIGELGWGGR